MLIINRKQISFIVIMIMVSVISFVVNSDSKQSIQTVSLPVSDKTIVLDSGHRSSR